MKKERLFGVIILLLCGTGLLMGQYRRGSYHKKLPIIPRQDMMQLPKTKKFQILRSYGKETHVVIFDMNTVIFYIDRDNTTEDRIDVVYRYDPWDQKVLKRIPNPLDAGKFSELKANIIEKGVTKNLSFFSYLGMNDFTSMVKKNPYRLVKRDDGFLIQIRDPDSKKVQAAMGLNPMTKRITIQNNYDFNAGSWKDPGIIYPVHVENTTDPTILRLIKEGSAVFGEIIKTRK